MNVEEPVFSEKQGNKFLLPFHAPFAVLGGGQKRRVSEEINVILRVLKKVLG